MPEHPGPPPMVNAHRLILATGGQGTKERLDVLKTKDGAWHCWIFFKYVETCPRGIPGTHIIPEVKSALASRRL